MGSLWEEMSEDGPEFLETFGRPIKFRGIDSIAQMMADGGMTYDGNHTVRLYAPEGSDYYVNVPKQGEQLSFFGRKHTILSVAERRPSPWIDLSTGITGTA